MRVWAPIDMSEASDKPEDQAPDQPATSEIEGPHYVEVSAEELDRILNDHRAWVESKKKDGKRANLALANLQDFDLQKANLEEANLKEAFLIRANLEGANLQGANLQRANLQGANYPGAYLQRANLEGANLEEANLEEAFFIGANLKGANLQRANLKEANFHMAKLQGANLKRANLEGAILEGANLHETNLQEAKLQRANLREAHLQEANLKEAKLQGADLGYANLREAKLQGSKLQNANLSHAALDKADVSRAVIFDADLTSANLHTADLTGADLRGANFQGATLINARLRETRLDGANLSKTRGLSSAQLADTSLTGAELPESVAKFESLSHVTETSKNARKIFLAMLLGCAYAWLTIATTTDARLLTNSASSPLPIIRTEVPIAWFYWAAPLILLGLYVYLHFYLERLWHALAGLPARFRDGKRLDERAYPWLLNGLVRRYFALLKEDRPPIARMEELVTIFLAWWAVPSTLLGFWLRYLPRHDWWGTGLQIGLLMVSVALATIFFNSAARTLRGDIRQPFERKTPWRDRRTFQSLAVVGIGVAFALTSFGVIDGVRSLDYTKRHNLPDPPPLSNTDLRKLVPLAFEFIGYSPFADLREADLSTKSENWRDAEADAALVTGANLSGSNLQYADAVRAFLMKADLRDSNLQGVDFHYANLQEADFTDAKLQKADLGLASLQRADLTRAKLKGARLYRTNFSGTNLENTFGLETKQLDEACGDGDTKLPEHLDDYKMKSCPKARK